MAGVKLAQTWPAASRMEINWLKTIAFPGGYLQLNLRASRQPPVEQIAPSASGFCAP